MNRIRLMLLIVVMSVCQITGNQVYAEQNTNTNSSSDTQFENIMNAHWAAELARNPTFATSVGVRDYDDRLADPSLQAFDASIVAAQKFLTQLRGLDPETLSASHQLNHALLTLQLENEIEAGQYGGKYLIINNRSGPHLTLTSLVDRLPFFTQSDFTSYLDRLAAMPQYLARAKERIRSGLQAGWIQPCESMHGYEKSIQVHMVDNIDDSAFMAPFKNKPAVIDSSSFAAMKARAA
ncbi:MAG: DUF885 family protein, partial [Gammaproteobacteria bacterium]|nr:DUF885 family protein [Gammaproteobacteria bacterium]